MNYAKKYMFLKKYLSSSWLHILLVKALSACIGIVHIYVINMVLPIADVGNYFLMLSAVFGLKVICAFGFKDYILRTVATNHFEFSWILKIGFGLAGLSFSMLLLMLIIFNLSSQVFGIDYGGNASFDVVVVIVLFTLFCLVNTFFAAVFSGQGRPEIGLFVEEFVPRFVAVLSLLIGTQESALGALFVFLIGTFVSCLFGCYTFFHNSTHASHSDKQKYVERGFSEHSKVVAPLYIISIVVYMRDWGLVLISGVIAGPESAALLAVITRLSNFALMILSTVMLYVSPKIAYLSTTNRVEELEFVTKISNRLATAMGVLCFVCIVFFGQRILGYFGESYAEAFAVLVLVFLTVAVKSFQVPNGRILVMTNKQSEARNYNVVNTICVLAFSLTLVPSLGLLGVGLALLIGTVVETWFSVNCVRKSPEACYFFGCKLSRPNYAAR